MKQDIHGPDVENATIDEIQDEVEVVESSNDNNSITTAYQQHNNSITTAY
jgi:hypothetical protein